MELCDVVSCHVFEGNNFLSTETRKMLIEKARVQVGIFYPLRGVNEITEEEMIGRAKFSETTEKEIQANLRGQQWMKNKLTFAFSANEIDSVDNCGKCGLRKHPVMGARCASEDCPGNKQ